MDLDRYLATHRPDWDRLAQLTAKGGRRAKNLTRPEIAELVALYQRTSSNLSFVRSYHPDPALIGQLTRLVSASGALVYGTRARTLRGFARFFVIAFPAAVWRCKTFIAAGAAFMFIPALVIGLWIANSPRALDAAAPPAVRETYVDHDFESYYESERAAQFGSAVFTNNVQVSITAFASGILFGIPTIILLVVNGANLGFAAGMFAAVGQQPKFWGLIAPHGLLELTSVAIAGGAGLSLGWALVSPGDRRRSRAFVEEGRRIIVIVLGLVPAFGVAGTIEGFVTGQPWPTWLRVGIGVFVEVAFLTYLYVQGRRASALGYTGVIGEGDDNAWASVRAVP